MTAPPAPRTLRQVIDDTVRQWWEECDTFRTVDSQLGNLCGRMENAITYAERVVPPVAPRLVPPTWHEPSSSREWRWNGDVVESRLFSAGKPQTEWAQTYVPAHAIVPLAALRDAPPSDPVREEVVALLREHVAECYIQELIDPLVALVDAHAAPATMGEAEKVLTAAGWTAQYVATLGSDILHTPKDATRDEALRDYSDFAKATRVLIAPAPERAP